MSIEKMGGGSLEKKTGKNEYNLTYPDGGEAIMELNPDDLGDVVYMEGGPNATLARILSTEDVIKGTVNHEKGTITWEDGTETAGDSDKNVVFAEGKKNELSARRIITDIMVGRVDKTTKTISFE